MNIKPIKTESDYRAALKRLDGIFDAPPGTTESDEADILGLMVDEFEWITELFSTLPVLIQHF